MNPSPPPFTKGREANAPFGKGGRAERKGDLKKNHSHHRRHPTIDIDRRPGNKAGLFRHKKGYQRAHFLWLSQSLQRHSFSHLGMKLFERALPTARSPVTFGLRALN